MRVLEINKRPIIIDGPGIYICRNGVRAYIDEVVLFVDPKGEVDRLEVTAFEAKGATERMFRGKMRFRCRDLWHISGRNQILRESAWDIVSKEA
ncbi:hypothetical protein uan_034 [Pseudomonas phage UAntarctica]|nr:hypothetical protein uan_034 [Pseudomonas phage UAntarctica]